MKVSSIKHVRKNFNQNLEHVTDIIEILESARAIERPMWLDEMDILKEAFKAHDSEDWPRCRSALLEYLEHVNDSILLFDLSGWKLRHIFKWQKMLDATKLGYESESEHFPKFLQMIRDQILDRIPPLFRLGFKDYLSDLSPGLIEMHQSINNDRSKSDRINEIIDFMEKDIDPETEEQST